MIISVNKSQKDSKQGKKKNNKKQKRGGIGKNQKISLKTKKVGKRNVRKERIINRKSRNPNNGTKSQ